MSSTFEKLHPQPYLTDRGKEIFLDIISCIDEKILLSTDSYGLSILANHYYLVEINMAIVNEIGGVQTTESGYSQIRAEWTIASKSAEFIAKHETHYGLNPSAREKLKEIWAKKEKKKPSIMDGLLENQSMS